MAKSESPDYILISKLEPAISLGFSFNMCQMTLTQSVILNVPYLGWILQLSCSIELYKFSQQIH